MNDDNHTLIQKSVSLHDETTIFGDSENSLDSGMFLEDFFNAIIPYRDDDFSTNVEQMSKENQLKISHLFSDSSVYLGITPYRPREKVCKFIRNLTPQLIIFGRCYFEIVSVNATADEIDQLEIDDINFYKLIKIDGLVIRFLHWYLQIVPIRLWNKIKKPLIFIKKDQIIKFTLPKEFRKLGLRRKVIRQLNTSGKEFFRQNDRISATLDNTKILDNNDLFYSEMDLFNAQVTKKWGWGYRQSFFTKTLESYIAYRKLISARMLTLLRNEILKVMNTALQRVDDEIQISITGLPTIDEIEEKLSTFATEEALLPDYFKYSNF